MSVWDGIMSVQTLRLPPNADELPRSESSERPPIDRAHLGRYTLADPRLEKEILGLFVAQLPLTLEALRFAASDRDWRVAAHTLKGSARAVGAWHIAEIALEAEKLGGIADDTACAAMIARIEEAVSDVETYVADAFPAPAN
jgi:HPt (histidine-containing phosphotransfer) domain-containing protein